MQTAGEMEFSPTEETFQSILNNDPGITGVYFEFTNHLAEIVGRAVSQSMYLQTLHIHYDPSNNSPELMSKFLVQLAQNRSIEYVRFSQSSSMSGVDIITILDLFLRLKINLRCIALKYANLSTEIPSLVSVVNSSKDWRLEQIDFSYSHIGDKGVGDLIDAFNNSPGLCHLSQLCLTDNHVGQLGCTAIGKLLKNPKCRVSTLELDDNVLDDLCINILVDALIVNNTLKCMELEHQKFVTPIGWCVFSAYLSHPSCLLGKVSFGYDALGDAVLTTLGITLGVNKTVTWVGIRNSRTLDATLFGWRGFSTCLRHPDSVLQVLILDQCNIDDDGIVMLATALAENRSVTKLTLVDNKSISSSGWVKCLIYLIKLSTLEDLDLSTNNIDDTGAMLLARLLGNSGTMRSLDLQQCNNITTSGWRAIAETLRSSSLQNLGIGGTGGAIDVDDFIVTFADALSCNTSLVFLDFEFSIANIGRSALAKALCDRSSIDNTFASNHTLRYFHSGYTATVGWLDELTSMNMQSNEFDVARKKILDCHFCDVGSCVRVFGSLDVKVLPTALSWMGRDRLGYSLMNDFLKSKPCLIKSAEPAFEGLESSDESVIEVLQSSMSATDEEPLTSVRTADKGRVQRFVHHVRQRFHTRRRK